MDKLLDDSDYGDLTTKIPLEPLECLEKKSDCKSRDCETYLKCTGDHKTHCFAITSINTLNNRAINHDDIIQAGCWSGGDECKPPIEMLEKIKQKSGNHVGDEDFKNRLSNFKLANSLLDLSIQDNCINYAPISSSDHSYLTRNNQSICCCSSSKCNSRIFFTKEQNPHERYANVLAELKSFQPRGPSINSKYSHPKEINSQEIAVISLSVVIIFILISLFIIFLFKRKLFFKPKNGRFFPSIFYTRAESNEDKNEENTRNNSNDQANQQSLIQIAGTTPAAAASFQPAPNIQILPETNLPRPQLIHPPVSISNLPPPSFQPAFFSDNFNLICNSNNIIDKPYIPNDIPDQFEVKFSDDDDKQLLNDPNLVNEPLPLKSTDLTLIEQVAIGQFSSVWKACLTNNENRIEFAIKIFSHNQKSAWSNEKEIYNCLITLNENILKYFVSDQLQNTQNGLPAFMSNEYWLITEYHSYGSLHDFLKARLINWNQLISLCHSYFEGLAYLHSDNCEPQKMFAIAHRDLKSKNVLVKKDGHTCCIADFGLALKLQNRIKLSSAEIRSKVGTRRYMSPELIEGAIAFTKETFLSKIIDLKTNKVHLYLKFKLKKGIDVYASALVIWEIISRGDFYEETSDYRLPFEEEVGFNPTIDEMKELVVDKCQRPQIKPIWLKNNNEMTLIAQTIEECWDIDLDARISAECAASRIRKIFKK